MSTGSLQAKLLDKNITINLLNKVSFRKVSLLEPLYRLVMVKYHITGRITMIRRKDWVYRSLMELNMLACSKKTTAKDSVNEPKKTREFTKAISKVISKMVSFKNITQLMEVNTKDFTSRVKGTV